MATLETQYKNHKKENPDSTFTFSEWLNHHSNQLRKSINDLTLYSRIENAIVGWNIDGTKTAGSLTRQIMEMLDGDETWEEIEEEYMKDEYPVFGGPFTEARTHFEWLKIYYNSPKRKE